MLFGILSIRSVSYFVNDSFHWVMYIINICWNYKMNGPSVAIKGMKFLGLLNE